MTMKQKPKEKKSVDLPVAGGGDVIGDGNGSPIAVPKSKAELKKVIADIAEEKGTLREIQVAVAEQTGIEVTQPTIGRYLRDEWGKDYNKKNQEMRDRKSNKLRWDRDFANARAEIAPKFHRDYLSSADGMFYKRDENKLEAIPQMSDKERSYKKKDIIHYVKEKMFGYSDDPVDKNKPGVYDPAVASIFKSEVKRRIQGLADDKFKRMVEEKFDTEREKHDVAGTTKGMTLDEQDAFDKKLLRDVRKTLASDKKKIQTEADKDFKELMAKVDKNGADIRSSTLLGKDLLSRHLCPAFSSSDKKFRGKQRMLTLKGINPDTGKPYVFSRVVYNIPELLWNHSKRLQVMSHNMSKDLPELLGKKTIVNGKEIVAGGEKPIVKGKFDDLIGVNLRVRMPRNPKEDILTREAGIVITKDVSERFRYFTIVEKGTLIAESIEKFPETFRVNKPSKGEPFKKYKEYRAKVGDTLSIRRGDPLVFGGFSDLEGSPGYAEAKHSGSLVYIGKPKKKSRTITVDPDVHPSGKSKVEVDFWTQDYQIVREDTLRMGDKIISRNGLKGVIAEIVDTLGKDEKGRPYEAIVNYGEVWREAEKSDPEYKIKEETYFKQGKKKSGVVLEHEKSDGQIFFFLINKMAQDQSTTGLRMSTTMLSGMWEWFLYDVDKAGKKLTQAELDTKLQNFVERYFGDKGTFVPSLKAMHYKAVKKGNKVTIEIDEREPTEDEDGKIIKLPHTYAGRTYEYAYIPNYISRVYFNGKTLMEYYQTGNNKQGVSSASDFYWAFIVKQLKNKLYLFPRNEDAVNLVAVPIYNGKPEEYDTVVMDHIDYINAGGNPYDKEPMITLRKEPVTNKDSIQTHPVRLDFDGIYTGCIGIHPESALKATIDYDGDQVVVFSPPIEHARIEIEDETIQALKDTRNLPYDIDFKDLYKKARAVKYAEDEEALGVKAARYNQETAEIENTMIQELGGLKKRSILFYGARKHAPLEYGSKLDPRVEEITPELINRVCDVEKILKMREPRWVVKELEQKPWDSLTDEQKALVSDYHIRRELKRRLQKLIDTEDLTRLKEIINKEKSFIEDDKVIDRAVDPINVKIEIGDRLIDRVVWQQLKGRKDILVEES